MCGATLDLNLRSRSIINGFTNIPTFEMDIVIRERFSKILWVLKIGNHYLYNFKFEKRESLLHLNKNGKMKYKYKKPGTRTILNFLCIS